MRITKTGGWAKEWVSYGGVPATTYYRKPDVIRTLASYGYNSDVKFIDDHNNYSDAAYTVMHACKPFRIVKK